MKLRAREISTLFVFAPVLLGAAITACGSDPGPPVVPGGTIEAQSCGPNIASGGIHAQSCGVGVSLGGGTSSSGDGAGSTPHPTTTPLPTLAPLVCLDNPFCETAPNANPGTVDPVWMPDPTLIWAPDKAFTNALATQCTPEVYYYPWFSKPPAAGSDAGAGPLWATAFCPNGVDAPALDRAGTIRCDTCTGAAPDGWHVVAWEVTPPCDRCIQIPNGCDDTLCLQDGAFVPVAAPTTPPVP